MNNPNMSGMRRPNNYQQNISQPDQQNLRFKRKRNIRIGIWLTLLIGIILIVGLSWIIVSSLDNSTFEKKTDWQAIFLNNNQVYFGKVVKENDLVVVVKNIYYLQSAMSLQRSDDKSLQQQGGEFALIKLGNEIHGPEDEMFINKEQVMFIENLKEESKIVKAIENYESK